MKTERCQNGTFEFAENFYKTAPIRLFNVVNWNNSKTPFRPPKYLKSCTVRGIFLSVCGALTRLTGRHDRSSATASILSLLSH